MTNTIAPGTTGQASYSSNYPSGYPTSEPNWRIRAGLFSNFGPGPDLVLASNPQGWNVTLGGYVTVPPGTAFGDYHAYRRQADGIAVNSYNFHVSSALTVTEKAFRTSTPGSALIEAIVTGGSGPFSYQHKVNGVNSSTQQQYVRNLGAGIWNLSVLVTDSVGNTATSTKCFSIALAPEGPCTIHTLPFFKNPTKIGFQVPSTCGGRTLTSVTAAVCLDNTTDPQPPLNLQPGPDGFFRGEIPNLPPNGGGCTSFVGTLPDGTQVSLGDPQCFDLPAPGDPPPLGFHPGGPPDTFVRDNRPGDNAPPGCMDGYYFDGAACVLRPGYGGGPPTCQSRFHYDVVLKACVADGGGDEPCCADGQFRNPLTGLCEDIPSNFFLSVPDVPVAPTLAKSAAPLKVTVTPAAWVVNAQKPTTSLNLTRQHRASEADAWADSDLSIPPRTASGQNFVDESVQLFWSYRYAAQAENSEGVSAWGEWSAAITLVSSTCTITNLLPAAAANLHGRQSISFHVADAGGIANMSTHVSWQGNQFGAPALRPPGTLINGEWDQAWETRDSLQGAGVLRAQAIGSDGLPAFAENLLTLANTPANNILIVDVGPVECFDKRWRLRNVHVGIETPGLSLLALRRYWTLVGLRFWNLGENDPFPVTPTTAELAKSQFAAHQKVPLAPAMLRLAHGPQAEKRVFFAVPRLKKVAQFVVARFQLFDQELPLAWKLDDVTSLLTAREAEPDAEGKPTGDTILFTQPGMIWRFDGVEPKLIKDLADAGGNAATSAAMLGDKIYFTDSGALRVADKTPGDAGYSFDRVRDESGVLETRPFVLVERVGDCVIALAVDSTRQPATQAYEVRDGNVRPIWTLFDAATVCDAFSTDDGETLLIACGRTLWRSIDGAAPGSAPQFPDAIAALGERGVVLESGAIHEYSSLGAWLQRGSTNAPGAAIAAWNGAMPALRGVAVAQGSTQLVEQDLHGAWGPGRDIENPTNSGDVVSRVVGLRRFFKKDGDDEDERLLVLTGDDGLLVALSVSALSEERGACAVTELSTLSVAPGGIKERVPTASS